MIQPRKVYVDTVYEKDQLTPEKGLIVFVAETGTVWIGNGEAFKNENFVPPVFTGALTVGNTSFGDFWGYGDAPYIGPARIGGDLSPDTFTYEDVEYIVGFACIGTSRVFQIYLDSWAGKATLRVMVGTEGPYDLRNDSNDKTFEINEPAIDSYLASQYLNTIPLTILEIIPD